MTENSRSANVNQKTFFSTRDPGRHDAPVLGGMLSQ